MYVVVDVDQHVYMCICEKNVVFITRKKKYSFDRKVHNAILSYSHTHTPGTQIQWNHFDNIVNRMDIYSHRSTTIITFSVYNAHTWKFCDFEFRKKRQIGKRLKML